MGTKRVTRDFGDLIRAKLGADPEWARSVEAESLNADIAQQIYDLRAAAGLTQKELAERVGTRQSVISRIEDSDYQGHSLNLLWRIARALDAHLCVELKPQRTKASKRGSRRQAAGRNKS